MPAEKLSGRTTIRGRTVLGDGRGATRPGKPRRTPSHGPRPGGPPDDSPVRKRWVPSPHEIPAPAGRQNPFTRDRQHLIVLQHSTTPRNENRVSHEAAKAGCQLRTGIPLSPTRNSSTTPRRRAHRGWPPFLTAFLRALGGSAWIGCRQRQRRATGKKETWAGSQQDLDDFSVEDSSSTKLKQRRLRAVQRLPMTVLDSNMPPSPATHQTSRLSSFASGTAT